MKKLIMFVLFFACALGLTACGQNGKVTYYPNSSEMQINLQLLHMNGIKTKLLICYRR